VTLAGDPTLKRLNGAEDCCRIIAVHESAWPIVNGFTRDRHVVGVHHAMDETNVQPSGDEVSLPAYHMLEQSLVGVHGASRFWVMARNHVVGEVAERIHVCALY
jgi:hypothetical protein